MDYHTQEQLIKKLSDIEENLSYSYSALSSIACSLTSIAALAVHVHTRLINEEESKRSKP